jgi:hypothetical protein
MTGYEIDRRYCFAISSSKVVASDYRAAASATNEFGIDLLFLGRMTDPR